MAACCSPSNLHTSPIPETKHLSRPIALFVAGYDSLTDLVIATISRLEQSLSYKIKPGSHRFQQALPPGSVLMF